MGQEVSPARIGPVKLGASRRFCRLAEVCRQFLPMTCSHRLPAFRPTHQHAVTAPTRKRARRLARQHARRLLRRAAAVVSLWRSGLPLPRADSIRLWLRRLSAATFWRRRMCRGKLSARRRAHAAAGSSAVSAPRAGANAATLRLRQPDAQVSPGSHAAGLRAAAGVSAGAPASGPRAPPPLVARSSPGARDLWPAASCAAA
jgi:hypothetical protein